MKTRESGMPEEPMWSSFFSPEQTLMKLDLTASCGDVVDFGCGYGTFVLPAARIVRGTVHALDIEQEMVDATRRKAEQVGLGNVRVERRDFMADGTGLPDDAVDYGMLFNILHCERPDILLREARRVLSPSGRLAIMHWNHAPTTPRDPPWISDRVRNSAVTGLSGSVFGWRRRGTSIFGHTTTAGS